MSARTEQFTSGAQRALLGRGLAGRLAAQLQSQLWMRQAALRRLLIAWSISVLGDCLRDVALAAAMLAATDSVLAAGLVFLTTKLPSIVFAFAAGIITDRWDPRRAMVTADVLRGVLSVMLPIAVITSLPLVYLLIFATSALTVMFVNARYSMLPNWVSSDHLMEANSLVSATRFLTEVAGYSIAGVLVSVLVTNFGAFSGTRVAFGLDALTFFISALLLAGLPGVSRASRATVRLRQLSSDVRETVQFLWRQPYVRANLVLYTMVPLALGGFQTLWVAHAWRVSQTQASGYAALQFSWGIGILIGLAALHHISSHVNAGRVILLGWLLWAVSTCALGLTASLEFAAVCAGLGGIGNILAGISSITLVQRLTLPELRGRVFGVRSSLSLLSVACASALTAALADQVGVTTLCVAMGAAAIAMVGTAYFSHDLREAR